MRLFVAFDLPAEARELIGGWQARQTEPRLRPVSAEALHVTKLVKRAGLMHGYLEDQLFGPHVETGKKLFDRRDDLKKKVELREVDQAMKARRR